MHAKKRILHSFAFSHNKVQLKEAAGEYKDLIIRGSVSC